MSAPKTIARPEIAELLSIKIGTLNSVMRCPAVNAPLPIGKRENEYVYDRQAVMAWLESRPLSRMTWKQSERVEKEPALDSDCVKLFLCGGVGSKAQRNRNQLRKVIAKHRPARTQRVEVSGSDDYTGSSDAWAGLV